jgi:hypothetical protein
MPELFVTLQPLERAFHSTTGQPATHHPAGLAPLDEPSVFQNGEMLDEPRQRHSERLGQLADGSFTSAQ